MADKRKWWWSGGGLALIILAMIWQQQRRHARPPIAAPPAVPSPALVPRPEVLTTATPRAATPSVSATPFPTVAAQLPPGLKLIIPVAGIRSAQLRDTFSEARSEGREHNAIDIMAPAGAPVLAAADGKLVKLFNSERGGLTLYQLSNDQRVVFYYAHLQRYAEGLTVGQALRQGDTIAYVGDTGNAGAGNYHLHFAVWLIQDARHFWDGLNLNPYSLLKEGS